MTIFQWRGRISKKAFVDRFRAALQERLPEAVIEEAGELELHVVSPPQDDTQTVWLDRAYQEFCKKPADIEEILSRWVRSIAASGSDTLEVDRIIPVIKHHGWLQAQGDSLSGEGQFDPWTEAYNSELIVVFAEYRDSLSFCSRSRFDSLGVALPELRERAFANLRRVIKEVSVAGENGLYLLGAGGTIDSSLLLLDEVTQDPRIELVGSPLVGISDRDSFWVADDANPYAVFEIAAKVARYYRSEPYPISRQLFQRQGELWLPLDAESEDKNHPIPNLDLIDIVGVKRDGGVDLVIIVASPLSADTRSVFRLSRKIDGYLHEINSETWRKEHPESTPESTGIKVTLHPDSDPMIAELLDAYTDWVKSCGAQLVVEELGTDE